jgi:hypothetical protein
MKDQNDNNDDAESKGLTNQGYIKSTETDVINVIRFDYYFQSCF